MACATKGPAFWIRIRLSLMSSPHVIPYSMYPSVMISQNGTGTASCMACVNGELLTSVFSLLELHVLSMNGEYSSLGFHVLSLTRSNIRSNTASLTVLYTLGPMIAQNASLVRMYAMLSTMVICLTAHLAFM